VTAVTAKRREHEERVWWAVAPAGLRSATPERELPEYWGLISGGTNFVSHTEDYPWMPVKVCEELFPF
jgi:hypothetical protein